MAFARLLQSPSEAPSRRSDRTPSNLTLLIRIFCSSRISKTTLTPPESAGLTVAAHVSLGSALVNQHLPNDFFHFDNPGGS